MNPRSSFWAGKKVLITGHTGFKGGWLAIWLHRLGAKVSGFALEANTDPSLFKQIRLADVVGHTIGDVRDAPGITRATEAAQPEIVFHLAAQSLVRKSYAEPVDTFATNVLGTVQVLNSLRNLTSVKAVVIVTTDIVLRQSGLDLAVPGNGCTRRQRPVQRQQGVRRNRHCGLSRLVFSGTRYCGRNRSSWQCNWWRRLGGRTVSSLTAFVRFSKTASSLSEIPTLCGLGSMCSNRCLATCCSQSNFTKDNQKAPRPLILRRGLMTCVPFRGSWRKPLASGAMKPAGLWIAAKIPTKRATSH